LSTKLATQSISEPIKHCKDDYLRLPRRRWSASFECAALAMIFPALRAKPLSSTGATSALDFHERFGGPCRSSERRCGFFFRPWTIRPTCFIDSNARSGTLVPCPYLDPCSGRADSSTEIKIQIRPGGISRQGGWRCHDLQVREGSSRLHSGQPADSVFYIREGRVKIAVLSAQGKEAVVALLKAGDFIGEGCLTGRSQRVSTARAVEDSEITRVDKRTMVRMLREEPNFSERFTAHLWGIGPTGFAQIAVAAA
jgi:Cyclic nucleotide-binding domain